MIMRTRLAVFVMSLVGVVALSGPARALLNGSYAVTVETKMTPPNCKWVGQAGLMQNGTNVTGSAVLQLDQGSNPDPFCVMFFPTLSGPLSGTVIGNVVDLTGTLGPFSATFVGTTDTQGQAASGTWTASGVPGLRVRGVWDAHRVNPVPLLSGAVLAALVLVLFAIGAWRMRPRQRHTAS